MRSAGRAAGGTAQLVLDGRDLYQRIPRVRRAVDLFGAGFAFRRMVATTATGEAFRTVQVEAPASLLKETGVALYIGEAPELSVEVDASGIRLLAGGGCRFLFNDAPFEGVSAGHLWAAAVNHDALLNPAYGPSLGDLAEHFCRPMIPRALLDPSSAGQVQGDLAAFALTTYVVTVREMRRQFAWQLSDCVKERGLRVVDVDWYPALYPAVDGETGARAMGHAYQVFRSEGIDLASLKAESLDFAARGARFGLTTRARAAAIAASFGTA